MSSRQMLPIAELKQLDSCSEATLLDSLDMRKHTLRKLAKETLADGTDYASDSYSRTGIRKILVALGHLVEVSAGNVYTATITKLPVNPNMLLAQLEDKTDIRVRVKSQVNFAIGMKIKVRAENGTPLFTYEGEYPRIRGRLQQWPDNR